MLKEENRFSFTNVTVYLVFYIIFIIINACFPVFGELINCAKISIQLEASISWRPSWLYHWRNVTLLKNFSLIQKHQSHMDLSRDCKAGFTSEREQNTNAAFKNDANVWCRHVTEVRQTAFGCATNVQQTAEWCYSSTVGTSKGIRIQYVYVGSIRYLGQCQTVYECIIHSASALFRIVNCVRIPFACRCKPGLRWMRINALFEWCEQRLNEIC